MERKAVNIPPTSIMVLESTETQWRLLTEGLVNELETSAIIQLDPTPNRLVRIEVILERAFPPENNCSQLRSVCESSSDPEVSRSLSRILEHLHITIERGSWVFVGRIRNSGEDIPIVVQYFPVLDLYIYSYSSEVESQGGLSNFMPGLN